MAEFIGETEKSVSIGEPVVFENKTDSAFEVSTGVVFHKSGIYEVSVLKNKTIVSKITERKKGEWIHKPDIYLDEQTWECSECGEPWIFIEGTPSENNANYCPNCGADMR